MSNENTPKSPFERVNTEVAEGLPNKYTLQVLTPRQRKCVDGYVRTGTYAGAAKASGYAADTCKRLLTTNKQMQKAVGEIVDQASIVSGVTLERVLQEFARLAFSDIGEIADVLRACDDPEAAIELLADLPADVTAAISEINITRKTEQNSDGTSDFVTGMTKIKFYDKKSALSDLGRMMALFNDKLTIDDNSGFGDRLERAVKKIEDMS